jgi:tRNA G37 N-methylase TrmD
MGDPAARPAGSRVTLLARGGRSAQRRAIEYAGLEHLVLICGRYKGVDERVSEHLIDEELSVGDFVLGAESRRLCAWWTRSRASLPDVVERSIRSRVIVPLRLARRALLQ